MAVRSPTIAIPHHSAVSLRATEPTATIFDFFYCGEIVLLGLFPEWNSTFTRLHVHLIEHTGSNSISCPLPPFFSPLVSLLCWWRILNAGSVHNPTHLCWGYVTFTCRGDHWIPISFTATSTFDKPVAAVVLHSTSQRSRVNKITRTDWRPLLKWNACWIWISEGSHICIIYFRWPAAVLSLRLSIFVEEEFLLR